MSVFGCRLPRVSRVTSSSSRHSGSASSLLPGQPCARPGAVRSEARCSAHRGTRPCTGRSSRLSPPLGPCAASARGRLCGSTWRSRGRRTAARAGRRLHPPSTAGTSSPPLTCRLSEGALRCATARAARAAAEPSPPQDLLRGSARSWAEGGNNRKTQRPKVCE
eukprot:scaffold112666_cov71-Phaeocystis_antarctica.AAC.2